MQACLITLIDTYNVCCHGNSCAYGLLTSFSTGYLISNAFWEQDVHLLPFCEVYAIAYTSNLQKHRIYMKFYSYRLCSNVICQYNGVDVRTLLTTLVTLCLKCIVYTSLNAHIFAFSKDNFFKFSVFVHNILIFLSL